MRDTLRPRIRGMQAVNEMDPAARLVLSRLRSETRPEHDAIEIALDLTSAGLTRARYRHTLERFYGYYQPLESSIDALGNLGVALDFDERRKALLLESDLRALGVDAPDALLMCRDLPRIDGAAAALGCLYVMGRRDSRRAGHQPAPAAMPWCDA